MIKNANNMLPSHLITPAMLFSDALKWDSSTGIPAASFQDNINPGFIS
jgi:hypothetical protein